MTTSDYLTQLQQDKSDLVDNLTEMGIEGLTGEETFTELVPEVLNIQGGGGSPQTMTEFNQMYKQLLTNFANHLNSYVDNYEAIIDENVTLYTPSSNCIYYMLQKKSNEKYRIVWSPIKYVYLDKTQQSFSIIAPNTYNILSNPNIEFYSEQIKNLEDKEKFKIIYRFIANGIPTFYYSNDFDTLNDLLEALQDETQTNISYVTYNTNSGFSGIIDENWVTPISNCIMFETYTSDNPVNNGRIISHNETITIVPTT